MDIKGNFIGEPARYDIKANSGKSLKNKPIDSTSAWEIKAKAAEKKAQELAKTAEKSHKHDEEEQKRFSCFNMSVEDKKDYKENIKGNRGFLSKGVGVAFDVPYDLGIKSNISDKNVLEQLNKYPQECTTVDTSRKAIVENEEYNKIGTDIAIGMITTGVGIATGGVGPAFGLAIGAGTNTLINGTNTIGTTKDYTVKDGLKDAAAGALPPLGAYNFIKSNSIFGGENNKP